MISKIQHILLGEPYHRKAEVDMHPLSTSQEILDFYKSNFHI